VFIKNITKSRPTNNEIIGSVRVHKNLFDRVRVQKCLDPTGSSPDHGGYRPIFGNFVFFWSIIFEKIPRNFFRIRYCDNCADWLCTQCKHAHARVRLTKDHIVTQKTNEERRQIRGISHNDKLLCQVS